MIFSYLLNMQSHPSWVCGLKPNFGNTESYFDKSHPSWVCGLKRHRKHLLRTIIRHTLRGCVD